MHNPSDGAAFAYVAGLPLSTSVPLSYPCSLWLSISSFVHASLRLTCFRVRVLYFSFLFAPAASWKWSRMRRNFWLVAMDPSTRTDLSIVLSNSPTFCSHTSPASEPLPHLLTWLWLQRNSIYFQNFLLGQISHSHMHTRLRTPLRTHMSVNVNNETYTHTQTPAQPCDPGDLQSSCCSPRNWIYFILCWLEKKTLIGFCQFVFYFLFFGLQTCVYLGRHLIGDYL